MTCRCRIIALLGVLLMTLVSGCSSSSGPRGANRTADRPKAERAP